jgi:hypothetical protein
MYPSVLLSRAIMINDVIEHILVATSLSCCKCIFIPFTSIISRPFEDGEIPTTSCRGTRQTIPVATIIFHPFEDGEMPPSSCSTASI